MLDLTAHRQLVARSSGLRFQGRVVQVVGLSIEVEGLRLPLGEICHLYPERATAGASRITAEVVGFRDERLILMPFAETGEVTTIQQLDEAPRHRAPLVEVPLLQLRERAGELFHFRVRVTEPGLMRQSHCPQIHSVEKVSLVT